METETGEHHNLADGEVDELFCSLEMLRVLRAELEDTERELRRRLRETT